VTSARAVLLMPPPFAARASEIAAETGLELESVNVFSDDTLRAAFESPATLLISFGTSVIVPPTILQQSGLMAVNIHAASPRYPGRDPHHFAAFDGVSEYGATMHVMTRHVDAGPIIGVERFAVERDCLPVELLRRANEAGFTLLRRLCEALRSTGQLPQPIPEQWGPHRYTRKEFLELARIDCSMSADEVRRRLRATAMPGYNNAYVMLHGHRFRLEDPDA
jgi:methionyl-tRNA formyltransferase